ncbi:MAG: nucleotidyltransferase family protein [Oscillospiraceae bacterium]
MSNTKNNTLKLNENVLNVMYLCACALHGDNPDITGMNLTKAFAISKNHSIASVVSYALENAEVSETDLAVKQKFNEIKNKAIRKNILFDAERNKLFQFMDENKIAHMALKGSVLKSIYPKPGMRQMADNDILFDENFRKDIRSYMKQNGYAVKSYGQVDHDVYEKKPIYNFEMHTSLFNSTSDVNLEKYYMNIWEKLILNSESRFEYHFTNEDFYIYLIAHAYKHYIGGGTGLRTICDCYVYLWKMSDKLDKDYISKELKKLGAFEFENTLSSLAFKLLSDCNIKSISELTSDELEMLLYMSNSGTYGKYENKVNHIIDKMSDNQKFSNKQKLQYILKRAFPPMEWYKNYCPFCYRHKWAVPFYCVFRFVRGFFKKRHKIKTELNVIKNK